MAGAVVVAAATVAHVSAATAALCIQWVDPVLHHEVGDVADVRFRTYAPVRVGDHEELGPSPVRDYPFNVIATAPDGHVTPIRLSPSASGLEWSGGIALSAPGVWRVEVRNFPGDTPCGPVLRIAVGTGVEVAPPASLPVDGSVEISRRARRPVLPSDNGPWPIVGAGIAIGAVASVVVLAVRRGRRHARNRE